MTFVGQPDDRYEEKPRNFKKTHYRPTDQRTDRPSCRDARTHLKITSQRIEISSVYNILVETNFILTERLKSLTGGDIAFWVEKSDPGVDVNEREIENEGGFR